jgi:tetratricopeptide (TPR) repeat protein
MKRYAVPTIAILALLGVGGLLTLPGQRPDKKSDKAPPATETKAAAGLPIDQADQDAAEGEFATALKHYLEVKKARPKWAALRFKIAVCQAGLEKKEDAANTLREVLKMKSASTELLSQARAALQELLLPKLSAEQREEWKQALSLIHAGEELKEHESEDLEIRIERKVFAGPYKTAIEKLETLTKALPDFAPAWLSLGAAHESLLNFQQAANGYRKFLELGSKKYQLPELEQQAQIRQRLVVCERHHKVDVELAKRIPGRWEASYDDGGETTWSETTTGPPEPNPMRTMTKTTTFRVGGQIELLPDGGVNRPEGSGWKLEKDAYWKVVDKRLIVGGYVGKPSEWCNLGPLVPSGSRFEGLTLDLHRTRYVQLQHYFKIADFLDKDLSNWEALTKGCWTYKDGALVGSTTPGGIKFNTFLCSKKKYRDFELKCKVRVKGRVDSGVMIRSTQVDKKRPFVAGRPVSFALRFYLGAYLAAAKASGGKVKTIKADDFNDYEIRCVGKRLTIKLNGVTTVDEEFKTLPAEGIIAWELRGYGGGPMEVTFKDIDFKVFPSR